MNTDVAEGSDDLNAISGLVIGAAFEVANELGCGFLEKVYEKALAIELRYRGAKVDTQSPLPVRYKDALIATYVADMLVEDSVLVELKCVERLRPEHGAQCLNYLKATGLQLCLLLNFQRPRLEWKRVVNGF